MPIILSAGLLLKSILVEYEDDRIVEKVYFFLETLITLIYSKEYKI